MITLGEKKKKRGGGLYKALSRGRPRYGTLVYHVILLQSNRHIYFKMLGIFMPWNFSLLFLGVLFPLRLLSATLLCLLTDTRMLTKAPVHLKEIFWNFNCFAVLKGDGKCSLLQKLWNRIFNKLSWLLLLLFFFPKTIYLQGCAFLFCVCYWQKMVLQFLLQTISLSICRKTDRILVSPSSCLGNTA